MERKYYQTKRLKDLEKDCLDTLNLIIENELEVTAPKNEQVWGVMETEGDNISYLDIDYGSYSHEFWKLEYNAGDDSLWVELRVEGYCNIRFLVYEEEIKNQQIIFILNKLAWSEDPLIKEMCIGLAQDDIDLVMPELKKVKSSIDKDWIS